MSSLAVTLTVEELRSLVRDAVREELGGVEREAPSEILTREEAAKMLSIHPHVVTRWVRAKALPGVKLGAEWRFRRTELLAWLSAQKVEK